MQLTERENIRMSDIKKYHNIKDLADQMYQKADNGFCVTAIVFYETAIELLNCLIKNYNLSPYSIELSPKECAGYDGEFYVSIISDAYLDTKDLVVERAKVDGEYLNADSDYYYVDGDATSKLIKHIPLDKYIVFDNEICKDNAESEECVNDDCEDDVFEYYLNIAIENAEIIKNTYNDILAVKIDIYDLLKYLYDD